MQLIGRQLHLSSVVTVVGNDEQAFRPHIETTDGLEVLWSATATATMNLAHTSAL
jgi:hypothetical protein